MKNEMNSFDGASTLDDLKALQSAIASGKPDTLEMTLTEDVPQIFLFALAQVLVFAVREEMLSREYLQDICLKAPALNQIMSLMGIHHLFSTSVLQD